MNILLYEKVMKIGPINFHNDLDYKTITRIHCKNEYIVIWINSVIVSIN